MPPEESIDVKPIANVASKSTSYYYSNDGVLDNIIEESQIEDTVVVAIKHHRCNVVYAKRIKDYLFGVIDKGNKNLIIDLQQSRIIDSTFLGALIASLRKIITIGGDLRMVCNPQISPLLFMVTGMDKVFKIFTDLDSAISSFND